MNSPSARLVRTELALMIREPVALFFSLVFPVVTMLIIGGSFGTKPNAAFDWVDPAHWYVASYLTVVIAATGLITIPVHVASYRERGVLRRFSAAGFPRWSFAVAQLITGLISIIASSSILLGVAALTYGIPRLDHPLEAGLGFAAGSVGFVAIGLLLGSVMSSVRTAQAIGLVLFFPSFLLGAGGPPPNAMGSGLRGIAGYLPLSRVTDAIRGYWFGTSGAAVSLVVVVTLAGVCSVLALRRSAI